MRARGRTGIADDGNDAHEAHPATDPRSSSYVATFDGKDALARLTEAEYLRRGGEHFRQVVALGDGAAWIWTMAEALYPHATHIVDIYHAREHLRELAAHLAFITPGPPQWLHDRLDDLDAGNIQAINLDAGNIQAIISAARQHPLDGVIADELDKKLHYFETNSHRMQYAHFKSLGIFTGSGATEAACKQIVAQRGKQSATTPPAHDQPGCEQLSDRQHDSDTQARNPTKIIPNNPVVHPIRDRHERPPMPQVEGVYHDRRIRATVLHPSIPI